MKSGVLFQLAASLLLLTACAATHGYVGSDSSGGKAASDATTYASGARTTASDARTTSSDARTQCQLAAPTFTSPLVKGGAAPAQPSTAPGSALAVMFGRTPVDLLSYTVQIVDTNGHVVASAKAHLRSQISGTCGNDVPLSSPMPLISASAGRVYYLDGDTDVRYLAPDGSTGFVTRLPGSSQSVAMFAVSPDDSRIAVAVFDYRSHPVAARLYIENLTGGARSDLHPSGLPYRWPVGWHSGELVVGSDSNPYPQFGFYAPLPYKMASLQLVDRSTGYEIAPLSSPYCKAQPSLPSPSGVACATSDLNVGRTDWTGSTTIFATGSQFTGGASLSPDGSQLLASGTGALLKLINSPETASTVATLGVSYPKGGGYPGDGGWLDAFHVVYRVAGSSDQVVIDVRSQGIVALPVGTVLAARLPGGY